ncbi:MAG TPA: hypothetical protein VNZ53_09200 [Steroidobacteraceae bacterium]|jgi:hypothetical protein|nr:hypothetical protein [Steroidobacteraceae bacterium]
MIMHLRPACLALALAVTAGPACAQTWVYEPDVGARVVYQPRVYQERYVAPVYNAYAYQPVVTAPTVAIGPTQRTVVSRTIIPQRHGRAPIVKERIVSETYGRRPEVVDYAPGPATAAYAYAPAPAAAAYAYAPPRAVTSAYALAPLPRPVVTRPAVVEYAPSVTSAYALAPIARPVVTTVPVVVPSYRYYNRSLLVDPVTGVFLEDQLP